MMLFLIKSIEFAKEKNSRLRNADFQLKINEKDIPLIEKLIGSDHLLVRNLDENPESYIERIFKAFPELENDEDVLLGLAIILHRNKTNEIFSIPS